MREKIKIILNKYLNDVCMSKHRAEKFVEELVEFGNQIKEDCAIIALAIDSNRGNEKEIAKAIRDSKE